MKTISWNTYKIFNGLLNEIGFEKKVLINTINQYSYCIAEENQTFKSALLKSDILLPDGIAIVMAIRLMLGKKIKKIAGADLHAFMLDKCVMENKTCFYLGSSDTILTSINKKLKEDYPLIKAGFYSPPFKQSFTEEDNNKMIDAVSRFKPDVLFVGMTAPKQETWAIEFKHRLDSQIICTIGAVFDFYSESIKRPNKLWIKFGLEWFVRFIKEPGRMWKRYLFYGAIVSY